MDERAVVVRCVAGISPVTRAGGPVARSGRVTGREAVIRPRHRARRRGHQARRRGHRARPVQMAGTWLWVAAVKGRTALWAPGGVRRPDGRPGLQCLDHPDQIAERQPESPRAAVALPDAEHRDRAVGVPAQPHAPGFAPDIEEDLSFAWQGNGIRLRHAAYRRPGCAGCLANERHWSAQSSGIGLFTGSRNDAGGSWRSCFDPPRPAGPTAGQGIACPASPGYCRAPNRASLVILAVRACAR